MNRRWMRLAIASIAASCVIGCVEPSYRYEVTSDGQGRVQTRTVPKEKPASVAVPTSDTFAQVNDSGKIDEQIAQLEEKKRLID